MTHSDAEFRKAYDRLSSAQKEAVDSIEGPVMVIAGPGTGKTQILTLRIAHILRSTDTAPENILALTFTEAGARAMRERLHLYIGSAAYRVSICTFHEFSSQLIRQYPDAYQRVVGGKPATDLEKVSYIESILETEKIDALRPRGNPTFYVRPIQSAISLMKREYITPDAFANILMTQEATLATTPKLHEKGAHKGKVRSEYQKMEKSLEKNRELLFIYRAYNALLTKHQRFDFDDMIIETVEALEKNEDMLRDLQERYLYILADEHQDVNGSQNRILELLASYHDRPNLFVVGDEKQAIYRFQGASLENFLFFEEMFPHTKTIALTENYRSGQEILDAAHALITAVPSPADELRVPLHAALQKGVRPQWREYEHEVVEEWAVVQHMKKLLENGTHPSHIAVLLRSNKEVEAFASLIRSYGIPANATADGDILYHPITAAVRALITAVLEPHNEQALFAVIHAPYMKIPLADLVTITASRTYSRPLGSIIFDKRYLRDLNLKEPERVIAFSVFIERARKKLLTDAPHRVLEYLMRESGFLEFAIAEQPEINGRIIRRLYDEVESLVLHHETATLEDVLKMFMLRMEHNLPLTAPYIHTNTAAVSVMTAHKAKGLEYEHVFVPHLTDHRWGDTSAPVYFSIPITKHVAASAFTDEDDERKLLYVAMTRAKIGLYLSCAKTNHDGRVLSPTRLIDTIDSIAVCETGADESTFNPTEDLSIADASVHISSEFLTAQLKDRGLSATSLNNYLRSPWDYLYRNVFRIPEVQEESALFGTAIHAALKAVTAYYREHSALPPASVLKSSLDRELARLPISVHEYARLHERGFEALVGFTNHITSSLSVHTREEYRLEAFLPTGISALPHVKLTGILDRLDYREDGTLMCVVDYKTGKPKTRGYIEGTTKDSNGDYKRQLVFYMLLLSLQENPAMMTREGVLSFVEPDEKGKYHEEAYTISEEEILSLKEQIIRVVSEITSAEFLHEPCDPATSSYCALVSELKTRE